MKKFSSQSPEETQAIAKELAKQLEPGAVVAFSGDLGAGKTTFIKSLISELTHTNVEDIQSPTFTYLNTYEAAHGFVYHFDLYRLEKESDFIQLGFLEFQEDISGISLIEWSEKISGILPRNSLKIHITYTGASTREIKVEGEVFESTKI